MGLIRVNTATMLKELLEWLGVTMTKHLNYGLLVVNMAKIKDREGKEVDVTNAEKLVIECLRDIVYRLKG